MSFYNPAQNNKWVFTISDNGNTTIFQNQVQSVNLPSMTIDPTMGTGPMRKTPMPSSAIEFTPVIFRFIIDENWESYKSIYSWMRSLSDYRRGNTTERAPGLSTPRTALVHLMDSTEKNIILTYQFNALWPSELGEVEVISTNDSIEVLTCNVTCYFSEFIILDENGQEIMGRT